MFTFFTIDNALFFTDQKVQKDTHDPRFVVEKSTSKHFVHHRSAFLRYHVFWVLNVQIACHKFVRIQPNIDDTLFQLEKNEPRLCRAASLI